MSVLFLCPSFSSVPTGGNIYNRHLIEQAKAADFQMRTMALDGPMPQHRLDKIAASQDVELILIDSLYFRWLSTQQISGIKPYLALLVHYLPSHNPLIDAHQRQEVKHVETSAIGRVDFLISSSPQTTRRLKDRIPGQPIYTCEPGVDKVFLNRRRLVPLPIANCQVKSLTKNKAHTQANIQANTQERHLLTVANLIKEKGHLQLLSVLSRVKQRRWRWHLVGDDQVDAVFSGQFWWRAKRLGLRDRIQFHGVATQGQLSTLMDRMDILVAASHYESYGMALAEAAAKRLPIITTRVGAADQLVTPHRNGFVVPVGAWGRYTSVLNRLIEHQRLRVHMSVHPWGYLPRPWCKVFREFLRACQCGTSIPRKDTDG